MEGAKDKTESILGAYCGTKKQAPTIIAVSALFYWRVSEDKNQYWEYAFIVL